jgi:hypothetical protein
MSLLSVLDIESRHLLAMYRNNFIHSRNDEANGWKLIKDKLLGQAFDRPFLMHAILALGAVYWRYISAGAQRSLLEAHHVAECTNLFNKRLNLPIAPDDRDAIWGTAATLGVITFCPMDAAGTREESWPLKPSDPSDLDWLRVGDGKKVIWQIADPLRPDSIFVTMAATFAQMHSPLPEVGIDGVDPSLARLCRLDEASTAQTSSFFTAVHSLSKLYRLPEEHLTNGRAFAWTAHMHPAFKALLEVKDPVALLVLYLWYSRTRKAVWWIELRARLECPAISTYLRRYHGDYTALHRILSEYDQAIEAPATPALFPE